MVAGPTLLLLLAAADPVEASAAQAELDICAEQIEALKSRQEVGRELDRLLRRAQELAAELERTTADVPPSPAAPAPEELRERADAARDEADRLGAEIAALDVRIQDARRGREEPGGPVARAALGAAPHTADPLRALLAERAALAERRAGAVAEASRLDREARAAEKDR
jgi:predicted  nucleic acid-binding Zn-ribbon protein